MRFSAPKYFVSTQAQDRISDNVAKQIAKQTMVGPMAKVVSGIGEIVDSVDNVFGFDILPIEEFGEIKRTTRNAIDTQLLENSLEIWKDISSVERKIRKTFSRGIVKYSIFILAT